MNLMIIELVSTELQEEGKPVNAAAITYAHPA